MFIGRFDHALDDKSRMIIPSKFREELGRTFVLAQGYDTCLYAYSAEEWEKFAEEITSISETSKKNRMKRRYFLSTAMEVEMDKQGRVIIPGYLRENAKIERDIIIAGVGKKIEIWSRDEWEAITGEESQAALGMLLDSDEEED